MIALILLWYFTSSVSLFFIFQKAGLPSWKALIPGLNFIIWCTLVGRPRGYPILLLVPIVNIFIISGLAIDLARSFNRLNYLDSVLAVLAMPFYFLYLGLSPKNNYDGPILPKQKAINKKLELARSGNNQKKYRKLLASNPYRKSWSREWVESLTFAIFAAAFIRMFLIEAYAIPTSSMEGSLIVGDRLFVSKAHYGIRLPMTIAMLPLIHNRIPIIGSKSYFNKPGLSYRRLPGLETIDIGNQIVFNWPVGDSVYVTDGRIWSARQVREIPYARAQARDSKLVTHPIDKREHYVKRCLGRPGDEIQIINREVYINGKKHLEARGLQFKYHLSSPAGSINLRMLEKIGVNISDSRHPAQSFHLTVKQIETIKKIDPRISIRILPGERGGLFPHDPRISGGWTLDNYGPIKIPQAGSTVHISLQNLALYQRIISVYEEKSLIVKGEDIYIDGALSDTYTIEQNYYWGMGDNRHNSEDSRTWGFIPEDHIVGKPLFILFSAKNGKLINGLHWDRILSSASRYN